MHVQTKINLQDVLQFNDDNDWNHNYVHAPIINFDARRNQAVTKVRDKMGLERKLDSLQEQIDVLIKQQAPLFKQQEE